MLSAQRASCPRHRCGPHPGAHACTHAGKQGSVQPSLTVAFSNCGGRAGGGAAGGAGAAGPGHAGDGVRGGAAGPARQRGLGGHRGAGAGQAPGAGAGRLAHAQPAPLPGMQASRNYPRFLYFSHLTLQPLIEQMQPKGRKLDLCCQSACAPDCMGRSMPLAGLSRTHLWNAGVFELDLRARGGCCAGRARAAQGPAAFRAAGHGQDADWARHCGQHQGHLLLHLSQVLFFGALLQDRSWIK